MAGLLAALIWPYGWVMVLGWTAFGAYFFMRMLLGKYERKRDEHIEEDEHIG
ncbi:hypothetical protein [Bacillus manliponensis]|uniref:hypothetical protein n=1 Tax=Bacillus manliponensis TaxID=574376 RepID=UPI00351229D8